MKAKLRHHNVESRQLARKKYSIKTKQNYHRKIWLELDIKLNVCEKKINAIRRRT